ncbi:TIGR03364 family FAD-dependent oxidoreductase [Paraflavitalea sp. CAU 1676]|uniref:TIGR03364 family FAD-dependent oxidoreductase n=1 Tax=Paraflavitalea sp. CAU 1676 TaxID=3032598 RepID=UPI0023D9C064|nr:TIGR03364 family FAD-dependent oxidoreductase [Paraflavitalea sp. CAU 1676]MDF2187253.1 TIGR03364 family FAD-dependent oxidoreductase [Paraflavitalea sp. CAU 1676]
MSKPSAIVIGAGIVGLATARALAVKGYAVKVFERTHKAVGASVRNFGMVWPIGQPGKLYDRALRSREIWKEMGDDGAFWYDPAGSLHLAYHPDEWQVLQELYEQFKGERPVELLNAQQVAGRSGAAVQQGLLGGLYSADELIVDPREAIWAIPGYLQGKYGVEFFWGRCVSYISDNTVYIGNDEEYEGDVIFICSGADFETLYPEAFAAYPLTKCKLQMMRFASQPDSWRIGPPLCGGLSLIHYKSFTASNSMATLKKRYEAEMAEYLEWGIHVMVSQNGRGELTVGDSHEYGPTHDPFDKDFINTMIVQYLRTFAQFKDSRIIETWNGTYPKLTNGETDLFFSPEPAVYVLNGLSGAGMTLSFGLAEESTAFL